MNQGRQVHKQHAEDTHLAEQAQLAADRSQRERRKAELERRIAELEAEAFDSFFREMAQAGNPGRVRIAERPRILSAKIEGWLLTEAIEPGHPDGWPENRGTYLLGMNDRQVRLTRNGVLVDRPPRDFFVRFDTHSPYGLQTLLEIMERRVNSTTMRHYLGQIENLTTAIRDLYGRPIP